MRKRQNAKDTKNEPKYSRNRTKDLSDKKLLKRGFFLSEKTVSKGHITDDTCIPNNFGKRSCNNSDCALSIASSGSTESSRNIYIKDGDDCIKMAPFPSGIRKVIVNIPANLDINADMLEFNEKKPEQYVPQKVNWNSNKISGLELVNAAEVDSNSLQDKVKNGVQRKLYTAEYEFYETIIIELECQRMKNKVELSRVKADFKSLKSKIHDKVNRIHQLKRKVSKFRFTKLKIRKQVKRELRDQRILLQIEVNKNNKLEKDISYFIEKQQKVDRKIAESKFQLENLIQKNENKDRGIK